MNVIRRAAALAGAAAVGAAIPVALLLSGPAQAQPANRDTGTCQWRNDQAKVLCVERAPRGVCRDALNNTRQWCWWWTGSDSQIVFNWRGRVVSS